MHPAYSVIIFTTASGSGYGLLLWLATTIVLSDAPLRTDYVLSTIGIALIFITGGLVSSTAHLGHPERAWRALSQWRSSWLSREGVLALMAYAPPLLLACGWIIGINAGPWVDGLSILMGLLAAATVYCTGMIYASLRTVQSWHNPLTTPIYMLLSIAGGGVLHLLLQEFFAHDTRASALLCLLSLLIAWSVKMYYWRHISTQPAHYDFTDATGLACVRGQKLDSPHTAANYIMKEMGYSVARAHAEKLRLLSLILGGVIPVLCVIGLLSGILSTVALVLPVIAVLSITGGLLVERWLFFAEAQHLAMLYYPD